ncbi:hypothetical protein [Kitasatospora sp. NPDC001683]
MPSARSHGSTGQRGGRSRSSVRLLTAATAALLCVGALSACGPDNSGQDGGKTAAPAPTGAAPTSAAPATGAPTSGTAKPTGGGADKGIPAKAWMDVKTIPVDEAIQWPTFAANAKLTTNKVLFKGQELCHDTDGLTKDGESLYTGTARATAVVGGSGNSRWTGQETLLYQGDPTHSSGTKQLTNLTRTHLVDAVKNCAKTFPHASVKVTSMEGAPYFAAAVTLPQIDGATVTLHEFVVDAGGTVGELSVFTTTKGGAEPDGWMAVFDHDPIGQETDAATNMKTAICGALPGCDGHQ